MTEPGRPAQAEGDALPKSTTALVWDDDLPRYGFTANHPMNPRRLALTVSLIRALGLVGDDRRPVLAPRSATTDELLLAHDRDFVEAIERLSRPGTDPGQGVRWSSSRSTAPI